MSKYVFIDYYILSLLRFKDDKIVFTKAELESFRKEIVASINKDGLLIEEPIMQDSYYVITLDPSKVFDVLSEYDNLSKYILLDSLTIGYYHHRVIISLSLRIEYSQARKGIRQIRGILFSMGNHLIEKYIVNSNKLLVKSKNFNPNGEIIFFYSYPLIIIHDGKKLINDSYLPFSVETETLFFDLVETKFFRAVGKVHGVRISIPSTIIYADGVPSKKLIRDIINGIYQHCLYVKKLQDKESNMFENKLNERILTDLWHHMEETMGGRTIDVHMMKLTHITYFLAVIATVISIISIILTFHL
ncbi:MAG: hypothetical protein ACTSSP_12250 [Candidatus Asgardarchaeia archaeon]